MPRGYSITRLGFSLIEIVLSIALFGLFFIGLVPVMINGQQFIAESGTRTRAVFLAEEGLEAAKNIRDDGFVNLTLGTHGLADSSSTWVFSGSSDTVDIYTRSVTVGHVDSDRRDITSTVTWDQTPGRVGSVSLVTRLTNWQAGTGKPIPITPGATLDLGGVADGQEIGLYIDGGTTYAIVGRKKSSDQELFIIDVSDPTSPSVAASLEIGSDVNDIAIVGTNAFLATSSNTAELQVVSLLTPTSPSVTGSLNLAGTPDAETVVAEGNNLYLGRSVYSGGPEIYSISIATPTSPSELSSLEAGDTVWKMVLAQSNTYVYAATGSDTAEMAVIDVSAPGSISQTAALDVSGPSDGTAIHAFSTYGLLGTDDGYLRVVDVSTPSSPSVVGTVLNGNKINDIALGVDNDYVFLGNSAVGAEVTIVNIMDPTTPIIHYSIDLSGNEAKGLIWSDPLNATFGVGAGNTEEFFAITP